MSFEGAAAHIVRHGLFGSGWTASGKNPHGGKILLFTSKINFTGKMMVLFKRKINFKKVIIVTLKSKESMDKILCWSRQHRSESATGVHHRNGKRN